MLFVIEVDKQEDICNNEKRRYLVDGDRFEIEDVLKGIGLVDIHCRAIKVHPATQERMGQPCV